MTTRHTHTETIHAHLMAGEPITTWQAYSRYQITCLAQRVHDLREAGLPIQGEMISENGKRFKRYWLDADDISRFANATQTAPNLTTEGAEA